MDKRLSELLDITQGDLVSITGAGGKTTLVFLLARELTAQGLSAVVTTTTKMFYPEAFEGPIFLSQSTSELSESLLAAQAGAPEAAPSFYIATEKLPNGKVQGLEPAELDKLHALHPSLTFLNEADGAAMKPYKRYREGEPLVPQSTDVLVHVLSCEVLDSRIEESWYHRCPKELVGAHLTEEMLAADLKRIIRDLLPPSTARRILLVNKADEGRQPKAERIAKIAAPYFDLCIVASLAHGLWRQAG